MNNAALPWSAWDRWGRVVVIAVVVLLIYGGVQVRSPPGVSRSVEGVPVGDLVAASGSSSVWTRHQVRERLEADVVHLLVFNGLTKYGVC
jgi:hypothetical protein